MRLRLWVIAGIGLCVSACGRQTEVVTDEHCGVGKTGCKDTPASLPGLVLGVKQTCGQRAVGQEVDKESLRSHIADIAADAAKGSCRDVINRNNMFQAFLIDNTKR